MTVEQEVTPSITTLPRKSFPVKILQFGSGNFLRGFADWMVHVANEKLNFNAGVCVVQSISNGDSLKEQVGVYTVILNGISNGHFASEKYVVDVIQRVVNPNTHLDLFLNEALNPDLQFIISNTTEAGIIFSEKDNSPSTVASTFPGKLTQLLYNRYRNGINSPLAVLPTELIENNGAILESCVLQYSAHWFLESGFLDWLKGHVAFCNTLVDRIVSGFPKKSKEIVFKELGYADELAVEGERFHLWIIDGPAWVERKLPLKRAGLNVEFTTDIAGHRVRKVRILNGAHTCMACVGLLAGLKTVREAMDNPVVGNYLKRMIYEDILPHLAGDHAELKKYADEVVDRFRNPAIEHLLQSISLNSFSKFNVRVLPSLLAQAEKNPNGAERLIFAFASLLYLYSGSKNGQTVLLNDSPDVIDFMRRSWEECDRSYKGMEKLSRAVLSKKELWGQDLTFVPQLEQRVARQLFEIENDDFTKILGALAK